MRVSLNWLKSLVSLDLNPVEIEQILTSTGLEVESYEEISSVKGGLKGLVVGEVMECEKHPNADKLSLTKVDIGSGTLLSIVCGAPNVAKGQKVIVATVGTTIFPLKGDSFTIQKAKIRGEASEGMLCAEDEIGLGESHDGIKILPNDIQIGTSVADYFKVENDVVFEIGLTANRGDAASHLGVARELATVLNLPLNQLSNLPLKTSASFPIDIKVKQTSAAPRYSALIVKNVKVEESPDWLKNKLNSIGIKSINNLVDISNYVLHELGQPLHFFDLDKIKNQSLSIDISEVGDKFIALDGSEYNLKGNELMISNDKQHLCMAGVYGGSNSGVTEQTQNILIESAYFSPDTVRKAAKQHGISTDSSYRFERGTDPEMTVKALERTAFLLTELLGETIEISGYFDFYPETLHPFSIALSIPKIKKIAGIEIPEERITQILNGLGITISQKEQDVWHLLVPRFKGDVTRDIDVIEELLRIYGLNQIPLNKHIQMSLDYRPVNTLFQTQKQLTSLLVGMGFHEIMTNSLSSDKYYEDKSKLVYMSNPLSSEMNVMRQNLLYSTLESIAYNKNRKQNNTHFFEFGKTYVNKEEGFAEQDQLIIACSGNNHNESWESKQKPADYYFLKSIVSRICNFYQTPLKQVKIEKVDSATLKTFNLKEDVYYAIVYWHDLDKNKSQKTFKLEDIPVLPSVRRDLSLVLDKQVNFVEVEKIVKKLGIKHLINTNVFDVYQGKPLETNQKSMSLSFEFFNKEKTLTDEEIDPQMEQLMSQFENQLKAIIRK
jgi:phenylalanyl-tRNA synthetase beta chain